MTLHMNRFEKFLLDEGRSQCTIDGYIRDVRLFARWFKDANGEALSPDKLTPIDVRLYRSYLQKEGAEAATINRRLCALRAYGSMLVAAGLVVDNPAEVVKGVKKQKLAAKWLDKRQQAALIRQVERQALGARTEPARRQALRDRAGMLLLLNAGLRVGELCDLELDDLEVKPRSGEVRVRNGKGRKARRIPLNNTARTALKDWLEMRPEWDSKRLLTGKRGDDLTANGFQRRVRGLGEQAGVEVTPHILRHTFAKNLVDAGISLEKVAALLGHENLNTTWIYTIPGERDLQEAVNSLDF